MDAHENLMDAMCLWLWLKPKVSGLVSGDYMAKLEDMLMKGSLGCTKGGSSLKVWWLYKKLKIAIHHVQGGVSRFRTGQVLNIVKYNGWQVSCCIFTCFLNPNKWRKNPSRSRTRARAQNVMGFLKNPSRFQLKKQNQSHRFYGSPQVKCDGFCSKTINRDGFFKKPIAFWCFWQHPECDWFGEGSPQGLAKSIWPQLENCDGFFKKNPSRFDLPNRFGKEKPVTILLAKSIWQGKTRHNSTCQMDLAITSGLASGFVLENRAYF